MAYRLQTSTSIHIVAVKNFNKNRGGVCLLDLKSFSFSCWLQRLRWFFGDVLQKAIQFKPSLPSSLCTINRFAPAQATCGYRGTGHTDTTVIFGFPERGNMRRDRATCGLLVGGDGITADTFGTTDIGDATFDFMVVSTMVLVIRDLAIVAAIGGRMNSVTIVLSPMST